MPTNNYSADHLNDPRIESVEGYFPSSVLTYAIFADKEDLHPSGFHYAVIHQWAKVRHKDGTTSFLGLTLFNLKHGGHAEHDMPGQFFVDYSDDPTTPNPD